MMVKRPRSREGESGIAIRPTHGRIVAADISAPLVLLAATAAPPTGSLGRPPAHACPSAAGATAMGRNGRL
jgi:hypothetical protein